MVCTQSYAAVKPAFGSEVCPSNAWDCLSSWCWSCLGTACQANKTIIPGLLHVLLQAAPMHSHAQKSWLTAGYRHASMSWLEGRSTDGTKVALLGTFGQVQACFGRCFCWAAAGYDCLTHPVTCCDVYHAHVTRLCTLHLRTLSQRKDPPGSSKQSTVA